MRDRGRSGSPGLPPAEIDTRKRGTYQERYTAGKSLREACPRASHAAWQPRKGRPDPVRLIKASERGRMERLLPLRHGRMARSPFTFYRGCALIMASDLSATPVAGVRVQCCGDAHLMNFGGFATPERKVIFSINDLDETLPAPWEWDVKRLAASFAIAGRHNGLAEPAARDVALACVRSYRERVEAFSRMRTLELWYHALELDSMISAITDAGFRERVVKRLSRERGRGVAEDIYPKLVQDSGGTPVIRDQPPTIFHWDDHHPGHVLLRTKHAFAIYRETLAPAHRALLDRYELKDIAIKVVGVGSVGTACWVLLLTAGEGDPLFLQVKQATASVLEAYAGRSEYPNHGQRVVNGYRFMQPASDIFLGWSRSSRGHNYYQRQLRDIKVTLDVEGFSAAELTLYAQWCSHALALSHARSGDPAVLSGYMGRSDAFDRAVAAFSLAYADQNEKDYARFMEAIHRGELQAVSEEVRK